MDMVAQGDLVNDAASVCVTRPAHTFPNHIQTSLSPVIDCLLNVDGEANLQHVGRPPCNARVRVQACICAY